MTNLSMAAKKPLAPTTIQQKISHVNFFTELKPPLLPGGPILVPRFYKGLANVQPLQSVKQKFLPPAFIVKLTKLESPQLIHIAILVQFYLGIRAGHFSILEPQMFLGRNVILPPFKFQKRPVMLPLCHVPHKLLEQFFSLCGSESYAPLLPWLPATYKRKFKEVTLELGLPNASHSARHTFGTVQAVLGSEMEIIQRYLIHKRGKTTETYVHTMSSRDIATVLANPLIFIPCSPILAIAPRYLLE